VFLRLVAKISEWFLEQRINVKFCVTLRKNTMTLVKCSPRFIEDKLRKSQVSLSGINDSKRVARVERRGRPRSHVTDENVEKARNLVRLSIRAVAV